MKITKTIIRVSTALSFLLFTAYQVLLMVQIPTQRPGRLMGIVVYVFLTIASFLALIHKRGFRVFRSALFVGGLLLLFAIKLLNAPGIFAALNDPAVPSVLNCAVYFASQLGTLILAVYYLAVRAIEDTIGKKRATVVLMSVVIVLYISILLMECVLIVKYRVNIDLNVKLTVISRLLYCYGFVGTAISFLLPSARGSSKF